MTGGAGDRRRHVGVGVRAYAADGSVSAMSALTFAPGATTQIDLIIGGDTYYGDSEYELIVAAITPALDGVAIKDLTSDDVEFFTRSRTTRRWCCRRW